LKEFWIVVVKSVGVPDLMISKTKRVIKGVAATDRDFAIVVANVTSLSCSALKISSLSGPGPLSQHPL
jgi:hypothetical protein